MIFKNNKIKSNVIAKYSFLIILLISLCFKRNLFSSYHSHIDNLEFFLKNNNLWAESSTYFDINELKNDKLKELYLKNKTKFYLTLRNKYLSKRNVIYNESKLITFQDKLNWLVIHESPQYKSFLVDKIKLHDYSKKILGKDICVPILNIYDSVDEIKFNDLPNNFVLKCNHGSGMNIICTDKKELNITHVKKQLNTWKNMNYGLRTTEFQYLYVKRRIFQEQFLSSNIIDYKIYCFHGEPKFILTKKNIKKNNTEIKIKSYYSISWKKLELEKQYLHNFKELYYDVEKPKYLKLMLRYAKMLSREFVFVRVDLYEINNKVYLGEL